MKPKWNSAYVAFGTNLGARQKNIERALGLLALHNNIDLVKVSPLYKTEAMGSQPQPDYFNGVVKVRTALPAQKLARFLHIVEKILGRKRRKRWEARSLDLDLLTYNRNQIRTRDLEVPHPRYHERRFVLIPFCELAPRFIHPRFHRRNRSFLDELTLRGQRVTMIGRWKKSRFYRCKKRKLKKARLSPSPVMTRLPPAS